MSDFRQMLINEQYLTVKKIGQGGFGIVWRAYDFSLRNYVAIKELLQEYNEPKYIEMLYKEALIAKNIINENIVRVQHFWKGNNGSYYISMDFVSGKDLEHLIQVCNKQGTKIPWELSVLIAGGVLKAIDYANRLAKDAITGNPYGLVYRDISPGNVMLSFDGNVKLSDFGIAKTAEDMSDGIKKRVVTGKYAYMSPEQIKGEPDVDHRSDIFSIGVVLYEMLTGQQLYKGETEEIRNQVTGVKFDPALLDNLNLPFELPGIIEKALEKDKEARYEKAIEMFRDLRRLLKGKETEELTENLSAFLSRMLPEERIAENEITEQVRGLNIQEIKNNYGIIKVTCKDFIVGETETSNEPPSATPFVPPASADDIPAFPQIQDQPPAAQETGGEAQKDIVMPPVNAADSRYANNAPPAQQQQPPAQHPRPVNVPQEAPKGEEKGKTVFEEVGDWLVNKFKVYRNRLIRFSFAGMVFFLMFAVVDTFTHITPMGKRIYSKIYPPDVIVTTIPAGATISLRTREGKEILPETDTTQPVELRKVQPGTYILTASKQNFRTVERVVKIEEMGKGASFNGQQRIDVTFNFTLAINSTPPGAEVFVDGTKFNVTPCKGEFVAGEHTIKLSLKGFEDLGALAKEVKEGQCNIDFTKPNPNDAFGGIDKRYWSYTVQNAEGGALFNLTGHFYKKVTLNSVPAHVIAHIVGESQARGNTPLTIPLKAGEYKVRYLDPDGRYEEGLRTVRVAQDSDTNYSVYLNKWVTINVRSKEHHNESFMTTVKITGPGVNLTRNISTGKPLRLALPLGLYTVVFAGDNEYRTLILKNINIAEKALITGEMQYENTRLTVKVRDEATQKPVSDAFVWIDNKVVGKTNSEGSWEDEVLYGTATIKIVAKGYDEKIADRVLAPRKDEVTILLTPDRNVLRSTSTLRKILPPLKGSARQSSTPKVQSNLSENSFFTMPARSPAKAIDYEENVPAVKPQQKQAIETDTIAPAAAGATKATIVCPNCGKVYEVGPKKMRFCINCGRPFK